MVPLVNVQTCPKQSSTSKHEIKAGNKLDCGYRARKPLPPRDKYYEEENYLAVSLVVSTRSSVILLQVVKDTKNYILVIHASAFSRKINRISETISRRNGYIPDCS